MPSLLRISVVTALLGAAAVLLVDLGTAHSQAPVKGPAVYPLKDIRPGMKINGESVFTNQGLEPFTGEVLAVMPDFLAPSEDLVLVKLTGPAMDRYGVVSGMSGSPVYIDGKLVGAVSYRFGSFPREPIAGVTPAESMLAILNKTVTTSKPRTSFAPRATPWGDIRPIETPMVCGGCSDEVLAHFGPRMEKLGLSPVRGSAQSSPQRFKMFPGGPIAGVLVDGDVSMMALGTITYMNGDDVLAFGHPFMGGGSAEMPMASAEVYATIPSLSGSAKLGRSGAVVGALTDDRLSAIAGKLGAVARTVPFHVAIEKANGMDARTDLTFRVVDDIGVGAALSDLSVANAVINRLGFESVGSVTVRGKVTLERGTAINFDETFSGVPNRNPTFGASTLVGDVMEALWRNPFERVRVKGVDLRITHSEAPQVGALVNTTVDQTRVRAGQPFRVNLQVRTHRQGLKTFAVDVPTSVAQEPGFYSLAVLDQSTAEKMDVEASNARYPQSLPDVIRDLQQRRRNDRLYVYFLDRVKGQRVQGAPMAELPPSMLAILGEGQEGSHSRKFPRRTLAVMEVDPGVMVSGESEINVEILTPRSPR